MTIADCSRGSERESMFVQSRRLFDGERDYIRAYFFFSIFVSYFVFFLVFFSNVNNDSNEVLYPLSEWLSTAFISVDQASLACCHLKMKRKGL